MLYHWGDVIALCILLITMTDVIAIIVADVVTTLYLSYCIWLVLLPYICGQMLLPLRLMLLPTISVFHG